MDNVDYKPIGGSAQSGFKCCPFCESEDLSITARSGQFRLKCLACKTEGPIAASRSVAIYLWNRRIDCLML